MKYAIVTFGCRVNQADSQLIEAQLRARGATPASPEGANVVVVNSCSVTASADQGTRQTIRRIVRANPDVQVVVTGCYATREPTTLRSLPNVVHVVPNGEKEALHRLIPVTGEQAPGGLHALSGAGLEPTVIGADASTAAQGARRGIEGQSPVDLTTAERFGDGDDACGTVAPGVTGRTALTLRVQTGCEERCSYCVIPQTRGAGRSRPLAAVVRDILHAVSAGYKEIVITGVHLGSYGRDLAHGVRLGTLVRVLGASLDDVLFRISSLEPMDCTAEIVDQVAASRRLAPHFHLPLQHGSDEILRAMRRPYTVAFYRDLVERIRATMLDASIGSDIIVGFPGETSAQFDEMRRVLEQLPLTHLHVFPYSDRPGTIAARLQPKVDGREIRERARAVRAIGERMARRFRQSQIGRTVRALTVDDGRSVVTENYLKLRLAEPRRRNEWVRVRVKSEQDAGVVP